LCDGFYFPVSFSTSRDNFAGDEKACQSRCSGGARLFYYNNYGGSPEDMKDRQGRSYASLKTAFLYRTAYKPSCQCRAAPWSDEAKQRHALYQTKSWQKKARRLAKIEHRQGLRTMRSSSGNRIARSSVPSGTRARTHVWTANDETSRQTFDRSRPASFGNRMSLGQPSARPAPRARSQPRTAKRAKRWRRKVLFGIGADN